MRPTWDEIIFKTIEQYKQRSIDSQTKFGCALVNPETHRICSIGMNGACPNLHDDKVPNVRPAKYPLMMHSEESAIYSLLGTSISPVGLHCFLDGFPCIKNDMAPGCLQKLYYVGITDIIIKPVLAKMSNNIDKWLEEFNWFQSLCKKKINIEVINEYNYKRYPLEEYIELLT